MIKSTLIILALFATIILTSGACHDEEKKNLRESAEMLVKTNNDLIQQNKDMDYKLQIMEEILGQVCVKHPADCEGITIIRVVVNTKALQDPSMLENDQ
jgi:hypothetical protein